MIFSNEVRLTARRYPMQGRMAFDDVGQRIDRLVQNYLVKLGVEAKGGGLLFRDPMDGRYWEFICPEPGPHGDTLPELVCLTQTAAEQKYGRILDVASG